MSRTKIATIMVAYLAVGAIAACYIAGCAYFVASKAIPHDISINTWYRYWDAYSHDPVQRKRLQIAASAAGLIVVGAPLTVLVALAREKRSLHGDARWASHTEIRKAGLL